jgi:Protein of unknown function (DUF3467)
MLNRHHDHILLPTDGLVRGDGTDDGRGGSVTDRRGGAFRSERRQSRRRWSSLKTEGSVGDAAHTPDPRRHLRPHLIRRLGRGGSCPSQIDPAFYRGALAAGMIGPRKEDAVANDAETGFDVYANGVQISSTPWDFTIEFYLKRSADLKQPAEMLGRLRISPAHALILARLLQKQVDAYQQQIGPISLPPKLYNDLGLEQ